MNIMKIGTAVACSAFGVIVLWAIYEKRSYEKHSRELEERMNEIRKVTQRLYDDLDTTLGVVAKQQQDIANDDILPN